MQHAEPASGVGVLEGLEQWTLQAGKATACSVLR